MLKIYILLINIYLYIIKYIYKHNGKNEVLKMNENVSTLEIYYDCNNYTIINIEKEADEQQNGEVRF